MSMYRALRTASSLGLLGILLIVFEPGVVLGESLATLRIAAVLATKERAGFDPRLEPLRHDLRGLPFKGYSLLAMRSCTVASGGHCGMEIPASGSLRVTTTECTDGHLKLHLVLDHDNRSVVSADLKLNRSAGILIRSTRTEVGTVLISIKTSDESPAEAERPQP
jgi:hypothetical protein